MESFLKIDTLNSARALRAKVLMTRESLLSLHCYLCHRHAHPGKPLQTGKDNSTTKASNLKRLTVPVTQSTALQHTYRKTLVINGTGLVLNRSTLGLFNVRHAFFGVRTMTTST
uniref:Uncharacterized protein n=1 Tax=Cacopsylla melanoneura TaxID=428564 RepID=A0A8D9A1P9_9HEMI